jgi:hypothetical protein
VLNKTPADKLETALEPILDIDGALWFLALDVALINSDGYWVRASDYSLYRDDKGKFHIIPQDMNEAFRPAGGPGMGGPGMGGPGMGGPGGPMRFGPPPAGELMPPPLQEALRLTDAQRRKLADLQKEYNDQLDKVLTAAQRAELKNLRDAGPGFPPPGGPGGFPPPGGPGGFPPPGGPGGPGAGGRGIELDPLVGLDDARKPLRSKLLAVPSLRARYLQHVRTIAEKSLDWKQLGPVVAQYRTLLDQEIAADTRKLSSHEGFMRATADDAGAPPGGRGGMSLRAFAEQRSKYLLGHAEVRKVAADKK